MVQLSHPYMTTGKTTALTLQTFDSKMILLLFNTLSRIVIVFLPRSKYLLISGIFKSRDIILPTKVCLVKAMVFPRVMCGCESWTINKA